MILWDFPENIQKEMIASSLSHYGKLIGEMSSPSSNIYTLDCGENCSPRYMVAKAIVLNPDLPVKKKKELINEALYEINNAHAVCHHHLIHSFSHIAILWGIPFLISRKRAATLRDVISEGKMTSSEIISITLQMCHAINYCNSQNIICHQDLKPENVFVDQWPEEFPVKWKVAIADFELSNAYLILRRPYGSRPYMAPEQYSQPKECVPQVDFSRVDVFAIGVMIFEMMTGGIHPIGQETALVWPESTKGKQWERETPWKKWVKRGAQLKTDITGLDPNIIDIVRLCLSVNTGDRISIQSLIERLSDYLQELDKKSFDYIQINIEEFNRNAEKGKKLGWPYYDELVAKVNEAFPT